MVVTKTLLRPNHILTNGDFILEISRFDKEDYIVWEIHKIDYSEDDMVLYCVETGKKSGFTLGKYYSASILAHTQHKNTRLLIYKLEGYISTYKILYDTKDN